MSTGNFEGNKQLLNAEGQEDDQVVKANESDLLLRQLLDLDFGPAAHTAYGMGKRFFRELPPFPGVGFGERIIEPIRDTPSFAGTRTGPEAPSAEDFYFQHQNPNIPMIQGPMSYPAPEQNSLAKQALQMVLGKYTK